METWKISCTFNTNKIIDLPIKCLLLFIEIYDLMLIVLTFIALYLTRDIIALKSISAKDHISLLQPFKTLKIYFHIVISPFL